MPNKRILSRFAALLALACLFTLTASAGPNITVSASSVSILGSTQTISLACTLIDPNNTGNLRNGAGGVITVFITNTVTPGTTATCGPIYGNDVITDGFGNSNTTYYKVQVFTVSGSIIASTPALQQFYAFAGSGTIDLSTATPLAPSFFTNPSGNVTIPGTLGITGAVSGGVATFTGAMTANMNGALNAGMCALSSPPSWCSGSDIGAWANAAYTNCSKLCTVQIPVGTYTQTTTIEVPAASTDGSGCLVIDGVVNYTGSSYAIEALYTGVGAYHRPCITGSGHIVGTSSGLSGIHLFKFNNGYVGHLDISGFTTGSGILCDGANVVFYDALTVHNNQDGIREVGASSGTFACVSNRIKGGYIAFNTRYGVFEDATNVATAGPNVGNEINSTFEGNGANGVAASGNIFIQRCDACKILSTHLEYDAGQTIPSNVILGDASNTPTGTEIVGNWFGSVGATNSILDTASSGTIVAFNTDTSAATNFYNHNANSRGSKVFGNIAAAVSNVWAGSDASGLDTNFWANQGSGSSPNLLNAMNNTTRGLGFNAISGLAQDLAVRTRSGGTNSMVWQIGSSGLTAASMSDAGLLTDTASSFSETTAPSAGATTDVCYGDSTLHMKKCSYNNGSFLPMPQTGNSSGTHSDSGFYQTAGASGCTTAASIGGVCATAITITWPVAFQDANYKVICTPIGPATNLPSTPYVVTPIAASVTINYFAITAAAASWPTVNCTAVHN